MLTWIIDVSLRNRLLVVLLSTAAAAVGVVSLRYLDIDAFPDTTPMQVQINTVAAALNPEEIEQQITSPLEQVMAGLPRLNELRSVSKFGLSQIVLNFDDGTNIFFARQLVNGAWLPWSYRRGWHARRWAPSQPDSERFFTTSSPAPAPIRPTRRTIHDWVIKPKLRAVKGTAEVNTWGGYEKQFQVRLEPDKLEPTS